MSILLIQFDLEQFLKLKHHIHLVIHMILHNVFHLNASVLLHPEPKTLDTKSYVDSELIPS
jgi:hypothetical protein